MLRVRERLRLWIFTLMLTSGLKYELDALANKDFQYLTKKYLPRKLKEKDWLD